MDVSSDSRSNSNLPTIEPFVRVNDSFPLKEWRNFSTFDYDDAKVLFIEKKLVDQPKFGFAHDVSFSGGSSIYYDTKKNDWEYQGPRHFLPTCTEENMEEVLFTAKQGENNRQIFQLLFSGYGPFELNSLQMFNANSRQWDTFFDFKPKNIENVGNETVCSSRNILLHVDSEYGLPTDGNCYFISHSNHLIFLCKMQIDMDKGTASWERLMVLGWDGKTGQQIVPTRAVLIERQIYVMGGIHGCGFRWQPNIVIKIDPDKQEITQINSGISQYSSVSGFLETESIPHFFGDGPLAHAVLPNGNWLHFCGWKQIGLGRLEFSGEIWALKGLDQLSIKWGRHKISIPDNKSGKIGVFHDSKNRSLFVFSGEGGVLRADFSIENV